MNKVNVYDQDEKLAHEACFAAYLKDVTWWFDNGVPCHRPEWHNEGVWAHV